MTQQTYKLGLIGYGRIAPKHMEVFSVLDAKFVACANRSELGRQKASREGNIERTYPSTQEMLQNEKLDGVICTAGYTQIFDAAQTILPFGVPTMLEKPPGTSFREFESLVATAQQHHTPVMVGLNRRHYSVLEKVKAELHDFEDVTSVSIDWSEDPLHVLARLDHQSVSKLIFGNSLHGLDLLTYVGGPILNPSIIALDRGGMTKQPNQNPFRWLMSLQGVSEHGALSTFRSTWDAPSKWRLQVTAENRSYVFAPLETCLVQEKGKNDRTIEPEAIDTRFKAGFYKQAELFLKMIETRKTPEVASLASVGNAMLLADRLTQHLLPSEARRTITVGEMFS